jgi:hypothetical protein
MFGVDRPAIDSDGGIIAQFLGSIVTWLTEGLKRREPEAIPVAIMVLDVVDHSSRYGKALACTQCAERMLAELVVGDRPPALQSIPPTPSPVRRTGLSTPTATYTTHIVAAVRAPQARLQRLFCLALVPVAQEPI